ncbi:hypothetical protein BDW68DRAFT_179834 [Aspergillus falconensis]
MDVALFHCRPSYQQHSPTKGGAMAIHAARLTDSRCSRRLSAVLASAFAHDPLFRIECPDQTSVEGMRRETERELESIILRSALSSTNNASVWAAIDRSTGQIVGFARWKHADQHPTKAGGDPGAADPFTLPGSAPELYGRLSTGKKKTLMGLRPFHCLEVLAVDPQAQGRGMGSMLVNTFRETATKAPVYCEANVLALPFYQKIGFEILDSFSVTLPDTEKGVGGQIYETYCLKLDHAT